METECAPSLESERANVVNDEASIPPIGWRGMPKYVPIADAAAIAGVSDRTMRAWANAPVDPIPHLEIGAKKLVRVSAIEPYAMTKEIA